MADYIIVNNNQIANFTGKAKRQGIEIDWNTIKPVPIYSPKNKSGLNAVVLEDEDIKEAFPALDALPQENETEIEFFEYDIDGNIINT